MSHSFGESFVRGIKRIRSDVKTPYEVCISFGEYRFYLGTGHLFGNGVIRSYAEKIFSLLTAHSNIRRTYAEMTESESIAD